MNRKRVIIILASILLIISVLTITTNASRDQSIKITATINVEIMDKHQDDEGFYIYVKSAETSGSEGRVKVENENVWNLLEPGKVYFTVISGKNAATKTDIFSAQNLILEQADIIK